MVNMKQVKVKIDEMTLTEQVQGMSQVTHLENNDGERGEEVQFLQSSCTEL